jgi:hypothetical protein
MRWRWHYLLLLVLPVLYLYLVFAIVFDLLPRCSRSWEWIGIFIDLPVYPQSWASGRVSVAVFGALWWFFISWFVLLPLKTLFLLAKKAFSSQQG